MVQKPFVRPKPNQLPYLSTPDNLNDYQKEIYHRFSELLIEFKKELPRTLVGKIAYNVLMHEEKLKNKNKEYELSTELLKQVIEEENKEE